MVEFVVTVSCKFPPRNSEQWQAVEHAMQKGLCRVLSQKYTSAILPRVGEDIHLHDKADIYIQVNAVCHNLVEGVVEVEACLDFPEFQTLRNTGWGSSPR